MFRAGGGRDLLFDFAATPEGTRVTYTQDFGEKAPRGLVGRLIGRRVLKPKYAGPSLADDLIRIERALETRSPQDRPARGHSPAA